MISISVVAVLAIVATLSGLNLLFSLALAKRIRIFGEFIGDGLGSAKNVSPGTYVPNAGTVVAPFATHTIDGEPFSNADLAERSTLLIFASVNCPACSVLRREIIESPPTEPLVFIVSDAETEEEAIDYTREIGMFAKVVWAGQTPLARQAFGVWGYPAVLRVINGIVTAASTRMDEPSIQKPALQAHAAA